MKEKTKQTDRNPVKLIFKNPRAFQNASLCCTDKSAHMRKPYTLVIVR